MIMYNFFHNSLLAEPKRDLLLRFFFLLAGGLVSAKSDSEGASGISGVSSPWEV